MSEYQNFVHHLAVNKVNQSFFNSDEDKMRSVFIELFNNSISVVRIFAGSLCNSSVENSAYIEALSDFIERKGSLRILLNNFDQTAARNSNLFKRLAYYISEGYSVSIKQTMVKPYITTSTQEKLYVHFATGDNCAYRLETDIEHRTAMCNMNDPESTERLLVLFDSIFDDKNSVDISARQFYND